MTKTVKKWYWVWQMDAEKEFLEQMAADGYGLCAVRLGKYVFEKQTPQKLIYQMDFRGLGGKIPEEEYLQLYQDAGWTLAAHMGGWYYFCREYEEGADLSLFNDNESKSKLYRRLLLFLMITGFPLYYQTIVILPNVLQQGFYVPFRIIMAVMTVLHLLAVL